MNIIKYIFTVLLISIAIILSARQILEIREMTRRDARIEQQKKAREIVPEKVEYINWEGKG